MHLQPARVSQSVLPPDFLEPLPFAVIIAKQMHRVLLPQPTMKLSKEFPPLRFRDMRLRTMVPYRSKHFQPLEPQRRMLGLERQIFHEIGDRLSQLNNDRAPAPRLRLKFLPPQQKRIAPLPLPTISPGLLVDGLRIAKHNQGPRR